MSQDRRKVLMREWESEREREREREIDRGMDEKVGK